MSFTIWAKVNNEYLRLNQFEDEVLAEKYLSYVDRFLELHPELEIDDLYVKEDGVPVYQIFMRNLNGVEEILPDYQDLIFDFDEMIEELAEVSESNPFSNFDYKEINLDEGDSGILEIDGLL